MTQMENFKINDIFPNPSGKYFTFTFISENYIEKNKLEVIICNSCGLQIIRIELENLISYSQYTVKTENLVNGIYYAVFNINDVKVMHQIEVYKAKNSGNY